MIKQCIMVLTLLGISGAHAAPPKLETDPGSVWRSRAAQSLAARGDAASFATAAALVFVGPASRTKAEGAKSAAAAVEFAAKASELAPDDPAIGWLHLQLCEDAPACNLRDAATTMRWVDADNAAVWLPTLSEAQKDRDTMQVDRVLSEMAQGTRFDLYGNRTAVMMFDALKKVRGALPADYLKSDLSRLTEAMGIAGAAVMPSFSPLINACREASSAERRQACLMLSKTMQRADVVMAQLVGFAIEKRLTTDGRELRTIGERRRLLEWRQASANIPDTPLLPWLRNARARSRVKIMRSSRREEDACVAILREHGIPLEPPEDRR